MAKNVFQIEANRFALKNMVEQIKAEAARLGVDIVECNIYKTGFVFHTVHIEVENTVYGQEFVRQIERWIKARNNSL